MPIVVAGLQGELIDIYEKGPSGNPSPQIVGFGTVRPSPMFAYADVTESNVISWVQTGLGTTEVNNIKDNINNGLVNIYNPPTPAEGTGVPW